MAGVSVHNLVKNYGTVKVLQDVSFEAADGEFIALVGPSGCGKSTLLRSIAGLESVQGGSIRIGGREVNNLDPKERDCAMVFQNYALYPHMTVRQNMAFSLQLHGGKPTEISARVAEAAKILGLEPYLERYPRQLSGGQRQRVAMGRAIVRKPSVFLFDEPLSNLDAALRVQMRSEIRSLHKRIGVTSIYVTHDQVEAMTMADKIVVMQSGKVQQVGHPLELYDRPCNTFVATFIGSPAMNLIAVEDKSGKLVTDDGQVLAKSKKSTNAKFKLGIRPEHIMVSPSGAPGTTKAIVEAVESTGNMSFLTCNIASQSLNITTARRLSAGVGEEIGLFFPPEHQHLFDALTGLRM
jgi:multiple sugar transport system ATP-binding protein